MQIYTIITNTKLGYSVGVTAYTNSDKALEECIRLAKEDVKQLQLYNIPVSVETVENRRVNVKVNGTITKYYYINSHDLL